MDKQCQRLGRSVREICAFGLSLHWRKGALYVPSHRPFVRAFLAAHAAFEINDWHERWEPRKQFMRRD